MSVILETRDLEVRFGKVKAVDAVSLQVERGETLGIVGEPAVARRPLARPFWDCKRRTAVRFSMKGDGLTVFGVGSCCLTDGRCRWSFRILTAAWIPECRSTIS